MEYRLTSNDCHLEIYSNGKMATMIPNTYAAFYKLQNNVAYGIRVRYDGPTKCDAYVSVDGVHVATLRLQPGTEQLILRPQGIDKSFFFTSADAFSFAEAANGEYPQNGKISVTFKQENFKSGLNGSPDVEISFNEGVNTDPQLNGCQGSRHDIDSSRFKSGTTILGGPSGQVFNRTVALITDINEALTTTIDAYLVVATK
jgi:hypothetical protein